MAYIPRHLSYTDDAGEAQTLGEAELSAIEAPVVILAEPGMGKTELLKVLARGSDHYDYVTARGLMRRSPGASDPRKLVIDGLDELSAAREDDPIQEVLKQLVALGSPNFILSCRAADWRSVAVQDILEDYGVKPRELRLEALTEHEAEIFLTETHGAQRAQTLLDDLKARGLSEFFGNPLTLQLINRLAARHGALPSSRAELYLQASDSLRREQNDRHARSPLATLSSVEALDAAGAACAALILTGSEAIALGMPMGANGDLEIADVTALPGASAVASVVRSNLFLRREGGDRVGPFHRALAEFLGARWLARQLNRTSGGRLLALLTVEGGVPASLRGLHAWLAHFSPKLAPAVMAADPYGVLRYGDAVHLTPAAGRALLAGLEGLASQDPYFRSEDWGSHTAPGLTRKEMAPELLRLLFDPAANFQLKSLILGSLPNSEAGRTLDEDLHAMLMEPDPNRFTFHERSAALDVLAEQRPRDSWSAAFENLLHRPGEDDRRLVVEGLTAIGTTHFKPALIARAGLAYLGILPGVTAEQAHVDTVGPLHFLAVGIANEQVGAVLDALVVLSPATKRLDWRCSFALHDLVSTLISRAVLLDPPEPIRLLGWLRLVRTRTHDHQDSDHRRQISQYLLDRDDVRRAIQTHVLLVEAGSAEMRDRIWRIGEDHPALRLSEADVLHLLESPAFTRPGDTEVRDVWRGLVVHGATQRGLPATLRAAAEPFARGDPELEEHLAAMSAPRIPQWRREQAARRAYFRSRRRRREDRQRRRHADHETEIRAGDWVWLRQLGEAYLNRYTDLDRDAPPRLRIETWLGADLLEAALAGFEALLARPDLPSPEQVAVSYAESRRWHVIGPLLAAGCERAVRGQGLGDLPKDVVLVLALGLLYDHVDKSAGGENLSAALDDWFGSRPEARERFLRLAIEPQFKARGDHVTGLHALLNRPLGALPSALALEWIRTFPDMPRQAFKALLDVLSSRGEWRDLEALYRARLRDGFRDDDDRLTWLAIAYFANFEAERGRLDAAAISDPNLFWHIRSRGWPRERGMGRVALPVAPLAWFIRTFRHPFPMVPHPTGSSTGDTNPWDASETLRGLIRRLATDTSDEAVRALAALRDEADDGYREFLQNACAQQLKARREEAYTPPSLARLQAVLEDRGPQTMADLQAITLDALALVQARMGRDDVDQVSMFHTAAGPKGEEDCRNSLVILLRDAIGHGIDLTPERLMPGARRADIVLAAGDLRLPVEAKGQWHRDLWTAAEAQLDARYAIEWRAQGNGLYLVFWFGDDVPVSRGLKPGPGGSRPRSAQALRQALTDRIPEHRKGSIQVVVLDVSRAAPGPL